MRSVLLGLGGGVRTARPARAGGQAHAPAGRHRFVQDGEVPVVRLSLPRSDGREPARSAEPASADAAQERVARMAAERLHQETIAALHAVQTRLGHAELALQEALRQMQAREEEAVALRAALRGGAEERDAALQALDAAEKRCAFLQEQLDLALAGQDRLARERVLPGARREHGASGRPRVSSATVSPESEPEPVKWWRD